MGSWINTGDVNPKSGTAFMRDPEVDDSGDFRADCIETVSETAVGGDEKRVLIRQGSVFLSRDKMASALETIGARIDGDTISYPGHYGEDEHVSITSEGGLKQLFFAAHAYAGIEDPDINELVQIGEDDVTDQERKFDGEITIYPYGSSIWSIIENHADGFDYPHGKPPAQAIEIVHEDDPRP